MAGTFGKRGTSTARSYAPRAMAAAPVLASGRAPATEMPARAARPATAMPALRVPIVTIVLIFVLAAVFAFEVHSAPRLYPGMSPPVRSLIAYGAIDGELVFGHGQVWRILTAPLLHGSLGHLIGNLVVFAIIGVMLEPLIGARWFAGLFTIGAIGGSLGSVLLNEPDIPAVGASGAIMGVLGAAFLCGASARTGPRGKRMQKWALWLILPALIPMAADASHLNTDFAGHLGGILIGLVTGAILQMVWAPGEDRPALGNLAAGIAAFGAVAALAAFLLGTQPGDAQVAGVPPPPAGLVPEGELPALNAVDSDTARALVTRYPHDPRVHLLRGYAFLKYDHDLADAEEQLRQALATKDVLAAQLAPEFTKTVTVLLALVVAYENRPDEARALGNPLCGFAEERLDTIYAALQERKVCD